MGTRQVELALALEPAWPWLALVATHAGTGAWPMAARTCVWQGARPPGSGISSAWLMADAGLCPGSRRLETFNLSSRQMSEKPRREQATAPPPPATRPGPLDVGSATPGCGGLLSARSKVVLLTSWPRSVVLSGVRGDQRLGAVLWGLAGSCSQALHGLLLVLPSLVVE